MGTILKEGRNWKYYWREKDPASGKLILKKRSLRTGNKKLAQKIQRDIEDKIASGKFNIKLIDGTGIRLVQFAQDMVTYAWTNKSPATAKREARVYRSLVKFCGDLPIGNITPELIEKYKTWLHPDYAPTTINIHLRHLRAAFALAAQWGHIYDNPFAGVRKVKEAKRFARFMTRDQVEGLLKITRDRSVHSYIMVAIYTGARVEEVCRLRWMDVYFGLRKVKLFGKGQKERLVPIPDTLYNFLDNLYQAAMVADPDGDVAEKYVCNNSRNPDQVSHRFRYYADKAKLHQFKMHDCRHTYASWLAQAGVPLNFIKELLGHTSTKVTEIYAYLVPSNLDQAVRILDFDPDTYRLYTDIPDTAKPAARSHLKLHQSNK